MNLSHVGEGKVYLIAGGGKTYTDIAAKFCRTERDVETLIASPQNKQLIRDIRDSGHSAALEFDDFIFGIQGYARVTEAQLIRKRHASYMIKSGRNELGGKRQFNIVLPSQIRGLQTRINIDPAKITLFSKEENEDGYHTQIWLEDYIENLKDYDILYTYDEMDILNMIEIWYDNGLEAGYAEEDLRYMKPQGTEFRACIKMNASGLRDWFKIRCCNRAQAEIRHLAREIMRLCKESAPELFEDAGPSCKVLGYCPESEQCFQLKGIVPTKKEALEILKAGYRKIPVNGIDNYIKEDNNNE